MKEDWLSKIDTCSINFSKRNFNRIDKMDFFPREDGFAFDLPMIEGCLTSLFSIAV